MFVVLLVVLVVGGGVTADDTGKNQTIFFLNREDYPYNPIWFVYLVHYNFPDGLHLL